MSLSKETATVNVRGWTIRASLAGLLAVALASSAAQTVLAQTAAGPPYQELPCDPQLTSDSKAYKDLQALKVRIVSGSVPFEENRAMLEKWYKGYFLPSFTKIDELGKLAQKRDELSKDLRQARTAGVRTLILDLTFTYMKGIATTTKFNLHPASRINALLMLGELNQTERTAQISPNPLPKTLDEVLVPEIKKANQRDELFCDAMVGVLRHAILDNARPEAQRIPAALRADLVQEMMKLVQAKDPPAGRNPKVHTWLQRRGLEIIAALGAVGPRADVNQTFEKIMMDPTADIDLRCTAARCFKHVVVTGQQKPNMDATDLSLKLGAVAVQATRVELDRINEIVEKERQRSSSPGTMGGSYGGYGGYGSESPMGSPGMGMMPGMPTGAMGLSPGGMGMGAGSEGSAATGMPGGESGVMPGYGGAYPGYGPAASKAGPADAKIDLFRRRLKTVLVEIQNGLTGMAKLAPADPAKTTVADINKRLAEVLTATDPPPEPKAATPAAPAYPGMGTGASPDYAMGMGMGMGMAGTKKTFTVQQMVEAVEEALEPLDQLTKSVAPPPVPTISSEPISDTPPAAPLDPETASPEAAKPVPDAGSTTPSPPAAAKPTAKPPAASTAPPAAKPGSTPAKT